MFFCGFFLLLSCGDKQDASKESIANQALNLDFSDLPTFKPLTPAVVAELENWPAFISFSDRMKAIFVVVSKPDLKLLVQELLEKETNLTQENYPEVFNIAAVKSRQRLVKTYLLKINAALEMQQDPRAPTLELLQAFNDLRLQLNIQKAPKLDLNTLKDEL